MKIIRIAINVVTLGVQSKDLQPLTAMFSEDKVTEIFCLADEFCKFFDAQQERSMLEAPVDGKRHRRKPNRIERHHTPHIIYQMQGMLEHVRYVNQDDPTVLKAVEVLEKGEAFPI